MNTNQNVERAAVEAIADLYDNVGPNPLAKAIIAYKQGVTTGTSVNFNKGLTSDPKFYSDSESARAAAARANLARISASVTFYTLLSRIRRHRSAVAV